MTSLHAEDLAFYDRTARGRLIVTGRDRKDLLHRLCTNQLLSMEPGRGVPACFTTSKGRLIDWTVVLDRGEDLLLLSANPEGLAGHIQQYTITEDVTVRNYMAIEIVVCGPKAKEFLAVDLEPWCFTDRGLAGVQVQVVRVEPLLGDGYVVLAPDAVALRRLLGEQGRGLSPEEVDALRVHAGIPAVPSEINEQHNPWEAGLAGSISLQKGCYVGQEVIARLDTYDKVKVRLVGVRLRSAMATGDALTREGAEAGHLTTVAGEYALAYVKSDHAAAGTDLDQAVVVALPIA